MLTALLLEQVDWSAPAFDVAAAIIVNSFDEVATPQGEFPVAVKVKVTLPAAISAALGVYAGVNVFPLVNVPVPLVLHNKLAWLLALAPVIATAPLFEQVD
jgi:hypothetical protein